MIFQGKLVLISHLIFIWYKLPRRRVVIFWMLIFCSVCKYPVGIHMKVAPALLHPISDQSSYFKFSTFLLYMPRNVVRVTALIFQRFISVCCIPVHTREVQKPTSLMHLTELVTATSVPLEPPAVRASTVLHAESAVEHRYLPRRGIMRSDPRKEGVTERSEGRKNSSFRPVFII